MYRRCAPAHSDRHPNWGHPDHDACGTGFMARLGGPASHEIVNIALTALERLTHRGGVDADGASGDGAGLLTSLPHEFFRARAEEQGIALPESFWPGFCFFSSRGIGGRPSCCRSRRRHGTPPHPRLAPCAHQHKFPRQPRSRNHAGDLAVLCRAFSCFRVAWLVSSGGSLFFASARNRFCRRAAISVRFPRGRWSIKACSPLGNFLNFTKICATQLLPPRSPSFTSAIRRTPSLPGTLRSPSATPLTTARSTPSSQTAAGSAPSSANSARA